MQLRVCVYRTHGINIVKKKKIHIILYIYNIQQHDDDDDDDDDNDHDYYVDDDDNDDDDRSVKRICNIIYTHTHTYCVFTTVDA